MSGDSQMELRVSRLENDRDSLYEILAEVRSTQQEHSERFEQIDQRFEQIDQRFEQIDRRFDGIDQQLNGINATLAEVVRRLPNPT